ncbi:sugar ABC transporter ATP-binding protein [Leucobacter allii]|uniref:sugar ABC transporter ATP-binding protein n=1 Tax=Leucobacter allii TaxID=2932247 RepID=UPI001FD07EF8|nr:sugar ABC transporter ATP-binding protein [Leucobacter allii]UOR01359.1 sugar ABC transporter ATP-binding protein [Leucobacter allii]
MRFASGAGIVTAETQVAVSGEPVLRLEGISKSFTGTVVLKKLDLDVRAGETLILLGENGAGKSTLKNILSGLIPSDGGRIVFNGQVEEAWSTTRAKELGLAAIHQELSLFPNMTVAENVCVLELGQGGPFVSPRRLVRKVDRMFKDLLDMEFDSSQLVRDLPLGQRQLVEIVKAVGSASSVLVLDEPTTSLSIQERQQLFTVMRRLRASGFALIHVTHFLEEVEAVGDRVAVMRDGEVVAVRDSGDITVSEIEQFMVGRELAAVQRPERSQQIADDVVLSVAGLEDEALLQGIDLEVRAGEVVGLAGLTGAGRSELLCALVGLRESTGRVEIDGTAFENRSVEESRKRGMVLVSEDRRSEQAFLERTVRENLTAPFLRRVSNGFGWMRSKQERVLANTLIGDFDVKTASSEAEFGAMSGGNQQKAILARWLSLDPKVCLLDEPTKGIDVGAKAQVQRTIFELSDSGVGVVVASSDLPELFQLCDRILVMSNGAIATELTRDAFDPAVILRAASSGKAA